MSESCECYFGERPAENSLELISEVSGSYIYLCSDCRATWERSSVGDWNLLQAPVPISPLPVVQVITKVPEAHEIDYKDIEVNDIVNWPQHRRDIIEEGRKSFHQNKGKFKCPYSLSSQEYNDYERGWVQAQKQYWNLYPEESNQVFSDKYENRKSEFRAVQESTYNAYAGVKGKR